MSLSSTGLSKVGGGIEGIIIPHARIESLKDFYTSGVKSDLVVDEDFKFKKAGDDVKGLWLLDRVNQAAKELGVSHFVAAFEDGGRVLPEISDVEDYLDAFSKLSSDWIAASLNSFPFREEMVSMLKGEYEAIITQKAKLEYADAVKSKGKKKSTSDSGEDEVTPSTSDKYELYSRWQAEESKLLRDRKEVDKARSSVREDAMKQAGRDSDALGRAQTALKNLKDVIVKLLKKVSSVEPVCREVNDEGLDPLEIGDLRCVLRNLNHKFRRGDNLQVVTTILAGMQEAQGDEPVWTWVRTIEEFLVQLKRLQVESITVSDFCAMVSLSGMNRETRDEFLKQESNLNLTLQNLGTEDSDSEDASSVNASGSVAAKKAKRTLFARVKAFASTASDMDMTAGRFGYKSVKGGSGGKMHQQQSEQKRKSAELEAATRLVMSVTKDDSNVCKQFATTGSCGRVGCKFLHKKVSEGDGAAGTSAAKKVNRTCFEFAKNGTCKFGNDCRFEHAASASVADVQPAKDKTAHSEVKKAFSLKKTVAFEEDSSDDEVVQAKVVLKHCCSVKPVEKTRLLLGWDSMSAINVVSSLDLMDNPTPVADKKVHGVGGICDITHKGVVPVFNMNMQFVEGGVNPSLSSVAKAVKVNEKGEAGAAIFLPNGAVRIRADDDLWVKLQELVDLAESKGRVEATATMRNNVYIQEFGEPRGVQSELGDTKFVLAVNSMYAGRVPLTSAEEVIAMLSAAGISEKALLSGIQDTGTGTGSLRGLPKSVTEEAITNFFETRGKDACQLSADMSAAALREPIDYVSDRVCEPGQILLVDNVDPSFTRMMTFSSEDGQDKQALKPVKSIGGYRDAVLGLDQSTGFCDLVGRIKKKNPEVVLQRFIDKWIGRWKCLRTVKMDAEFVTEKSILMKERLHLRFKQAVPGMHSRVLGMEEGSLRWIQDVAQGHMNRLTPLVKKGKLTEKVARSLWFHALELARIGILLKESLRKNGKTRFEEGYDVVPNLSEIVMLPFATSIIVRRIGSDPNGRGHEALYLQPSLLVPGGIVTLSLQTLRVSVKYSFKPREHLPELDDLSLYHSINVFYGDLYKIEAPRGGVEVLNSSNSESLARIGAPSGGKHPAPVEPARCVPQIERVASFEAPGVVSGNSTTSTAVGSGEQSEDLARPRRRIPQKSVLESLVCIKDGASGERIYLVAMQTEVNMDVDVRPPKPPLPNRSEASKSVRWMRADQREVKKLLEEAVFGSLAVDNMGRTIRPVHAIVLRLLRIREWKWKPDPDTGNMGWLECVRIVVDGSQDQSTGSYYAVTPDRMIMFLMASANATLGYEEKNTDAVRAYLNAPSLVKNIVVKAPRDMVGIPGESLLLKGLYGSKSGALSWEVWCDNVLINSLEYVKCSVARGVYMKDDVGVITRVLRHSDDFYLSGTLPDRIKHEYMKMAEKIRLTAPEEMKRLLGCTFTRISAVTGLPDPNGTVVLVHQKECIREMETKFGHLRQVYNTKSRVRKTPAPLNNIRSDEVLSVEQKALLNEPEVKEYQGLAGIMNWLVNSTRVDAFFSYWICAKRLSNPRVWDMYLLVWCMEWIVNTIDCPLVLGGPVLKTETMSDASFATLAQARSVCGHFCRTGPSSGAVFAHISQTKNAVKSIWEAELTSASDASETGTYAFNVMNELKYPNESANKVSTDSQTTIDWIMGSTPTKASRHIETRLYNLRHRYDAGMFSLEHVATDDNIADILTKSLPLRKFRKFASKILGHDLIKGLGVPGYIEYEE